MTDKKSGWNDWTELKQKHFDKIGSFDSLTLWLISGKDTTFVSLDALSLWLIANKDTINPTFVQIRKLPMDKRRLIDDLDIQTISLETDFCSMTDTRGGMRVTYEFSKKKDENIYSYLMYARCMTSDLENKIESNGIYINIDDRWYLIQKNYDWLKE